MTELIKGVLYLILGLCQIVSSEFRPFILINALINTVFFSAVYFLLSNLSIHSYHYTSQNSSIIKLIYTIFWLFFFYGVLSFFVSMFAVLFNTMIAPLNGKIAEKAQNALYKIPVTPISYKEMMVRTYIRQLQFLGYLLPRFLGMMLLLFIPYIKSIYPYLLFLFTSWLLSTQFQNFVMANNQLSFKQMRTLMKDKWKLNLGFGCALNFLTFIPLLNFITFPAAVIGSVILCCEEYYDKPTRNLFKRSL